MKASEITLREAIEFVDKFCPIKIIFNGIMLYNDYDSEMVAQVLKDGQKVYGEIDLPINIIPNRLWCFDYYVVTDINIEIVQHHHSVVTMQGYFEEGLIND